jgi:RimJ/RimL family protein N-acetyltransferase
VRERAYKKGSVGVVYHVDPEGTVFAYYGPRLIGEMAIGEADIDEALDLDEDGSLTRAYAGGHVGDYVTFVRHAGLVEAYWGRGYGLGMYRAWIERAQPEQIAFVSGARVGAETSESATRVWQALRKLYLGGPGWVLPKRRV